MWHSAVVFWFTAQLLLLGNYSCVAYLIGNASKRHCSDPAVSLDKAVCRSVHTACN